MSFAEHFRFFGAQALRSDGKKGTPFFRISFITSDILEERAVGCKGIVKWYNTEKGFGYIEHQNGEDVFVTCKGLVREELVPLKEGDRVVFDLIQQGTGVCADNVVVAK